MEKVFCDRAERLVPFPNIVLVVTVLRKKGVVFLVLSLTNSEMFIKNLFF